MYEEDILGKPNGKCEMLARLIWMPRTVSILTGRFFDVEMLRFDTRGHLYVSDNLVGLYIHAEEL